MSRIYKMVREQAPRRAVIKPGPGNCPRRLGFVYEGSDFHGAYLSCVNCGGCWHLGSPRTGQARARPPEKRVGTNADQGASSPARMPGTVRLAREMAGKPGPGGMNQTGDEWQ